jgi:hypothetical protein
VLKGGLVLLGLRPFARRLLGLLAERAESGEAGKENGIGTRSVKERHAKAPSTAVAHGAPLYQSVGGRAVMRIPAPPSGLVRRVTIIPVPKATTSAAPFIRRPKAAIAAQRANMSLSRNSSIPPSSGP